MPLLINLFISLLELKNIYYKNPLKEQPMFYQKSAFSVSLRYKNSFYLDKLGCSANNYFQFYL